MGSKAEAIFDDRSSANNSASDPGSALGSTSTTVKAALAGTNEDDAEPSAYGSVEETEVIDLAGVSASRESAMLSDYE